MVARNDIDVALQSMKNPESRIWFQERKVTHEPNRIVISDDRVPSHDHVLVHCIDRIERSIAITNYVLVTEMGVTTGEVFHDCLR